MGWKEHASTFSALTVETFLKLAGDDYTWLVRC